MLFGEYIRRLRKKRGLRQSEVAAAAGIGQTYLSDLERGVATHPSREVLSGLAHALDVPLTDMLQAAWGESPPEVPSYTELPEPLVRLMQRLGRYLNDRDWERISAYAEGLAADRAEQSNAMADRDQANEGEA